MYGGSNNQFLAKAEVFLTQNCNKKLPFNIKVIANGVGENFH